VSDAPVEIRPLGATDVEAAVALRREALRDAPLAFAASPESDYGSDPEAVRARLAEAPDWLSLGAFDGDRLVGMAHVSRERAPKARHRANLFGMYVTPGHRRRGVAARLLAAAIDHARAQPGLAWLQLGVSETAPGARALYEAAGFVAWGEQPDALRDGGRRVAETHMALDLARRPG
jgi:ribosomal protein S18 acetylase RimI-like enzyme